MAINNKYLHTVYSHTIIGLLHTVRFVVNLLNPGLPNHSSHLPSVIFKRMKDSNDQDLLVVNAVNNLVLHRFQQCLPVPPQEQVFIRTVRKLIWVIN